MFSGSTTIAAGGVFSVSNIPAGTALGVNPGAGGSMLVQYRISSNGPLFDWPAGTVTQQMSDVTGSPSFQVVFSAINANGFAEWNAPQRMS